MKTLLFLLLAVGGAGSVLGACEIHVAPNGNDANPGTAAQPLATPLLLAQARLPKLLVL